MSVPTRQFREHRQRSKRPDLGYTFAQRAQKGIRHETFAESLCRPCPDLVIDGLLSPWTWHVWTLWRMLDRCMWNRWLSIWRAVRWSERRNANRIYEWSGCNRPLLYNDGCGTSGESAAALSQPCVATESRRARRIGPALATCFMLRCMHPAR